MGARDRLKAIDWQLILLRGVETDAAKQQVADLYAERRQVQKVVLREQEVRMSRDKARELRKAYQAAFDKLAAKLTESQSDRYPVEFRQREGASIRQEMVRLEVAFNREMLLWHHSQKVEASVLRQQTPTLDAAGETRRLREQMEVDSLAKQYPSKVQAQNFLIPQARAALDGGNLDRAQVFFAAAKQSGYTDGALERDINITLDRVVPHRHQAIELEVMAADEVELARRDVAKALLVHEGVGTPAERIRASNTVQMVEYKRSQEAPILKEQHGIELPPAD